VGFKQLDLTCGRTFGRSLDSLLEECQREADMGKFHVALRKFLTCLNAAKYSTVNDHPPCKLSHYGLNFPLYTHFTSPIRRYSDLLVHRLVTLSLQYKERTRELIEGMDYSEFAEMCSEKSLNAKKASNMCIRLFHCLLLQKQGRKVFESLIFDIEASGFIYIYIEEVNMH